MNSRKTKPQTKIEKAEEIREAKRLPMIKDRDELIEKIKNLPWDQIFSDSIESTPTEQLRNRTFELLKMILGKETKHECIELLVEEDPEILLYLQRANGFLSQQNTPPNLEALIFISRTELELRC